MNFSMFIPSLSDNQQTTTCKPITNYGEFNSFTKRNNKRNP